MKNPLDFKHMMDTPVGELVTENYRFAAVFRQFGVDFCCGGKKTLGEVCASGGVDRKALQQALQKVVSLQDAEAQPDVRNWPLDLLADYIVRIHHSYVRKNLPPLLEFTSKLAEVHGKAHPELVEIATLVQALAAELQPHMVKEEQVLFPYLKALVAVAEGNRDVSLPALGSVENPIRVMESEHEAAGEIIKRIRRLSNQFTVPQDACNTYRVTYRLLEAFESDLFRHIHLENNVLFPKAVELEKQLKTATGKR